MCAHKSIVYGDDHVYIGCVSEEEDECEPMAHGGVRREETCQGCGATRVVNINLWAEEESPWCADEREAY